MVEASPELIAAADAIYDADDITEHLMALTVFAGLPIVTLAGAHLTVDLLDKAILHLALKVWRVLIAAIVAAVLALAGWLFVQQGVNAAAISEAVLSYDLAVVPMFILMGNVISRAGVASDLFRAACAFVGQVRGGLALSTMAACAGFSAVCGSSYATAATMAKVAYSSMKRYGYSDELATGAIAAGGTLGILIPPSITSCCFLG